jgi:MoaA/NifB/PqqE/SkfB family radical SAM enzyme
MLFGALRRINRFIPERFKFKVLKLYRALPCCLGHIVIYPLFGCNYHCSYCLNEKYLPLSLRETIYGARQWVEAFNVLPRSLITISGGEPLLYPNLDTLIIELSRRHIVSQVVSNLSLDIAPLLRAKKAGFRIMASYHPEFADLDEFTRKLLVLRKAGFSLMVNYVASRDNLVKAKELDSLFNKKLKIFFKIDACEEAVDNVSPLLTGVNECKSIYGFNTFVDSKAFDNYRRKVCTAGSNFFVIASDGGVYRCHSGFKYCVMPQYLPFSGGAGNNEFFLGNIFKGSFQPQKASFSCQAPCKSICDIPFANVRLK